MANRPRDNPDVFARKFLKDHCRLPFAKVHQLLFRWHLEMGREPLPGRRGRRYVLAAPRGCAKSTVASLILVLHDILYMREKYIVLLSATERQAQQRLVAISQAMQHNPLRQFFVDKQDTHFTKGSFRINSTQVDAYGANAEIRGLGSGGFRPTKIILDDAESSRSADSARAREKLLAWFNEVVEHLGDTYTNILVIGTVLHKQGLIAHLSQRPDFEGHIASSIESFSTLTELWKEWQRLLLDISDPSRRETAREFFTARRATMEEGSSVIWPQKEDYEDLMAQLTLQGRRAFYQEKQNKPLGAEDAMFRSEGVMHAIESDGAWEIVSRENGIQVPVRRYTDWEKTARRLGFLDSAMGSRSRSGSGDFAVLATVLLLADGSLILESLWAQHANPTDQVQRIFAAHEARPFTLLGIEGTGFQELIVDLMKKEQAARRRSGRPCDPPLRVVHPRMNKQTRIAALQPLLANGVLALSPGLDLEFWEELDNYPRCEHDDALDAAASAVALAQEGAGGTVNIASMPRQHKPGDWER